MTKKQGRPALYDPETTPQQAQKLCQLGATDEEIADFFSVSSRTVYRWKLEHEEFCQALKAGKEQSDDRVERGLYQKATGFYYVEQQAIKVKTGPHKEKIEIVDVERYQPADTTAQIFWLKNRKQDEWRDKREVDVTHKRGADELTEAELAEYLSGGSGAGASEQTPGAPQLN